jgi:selenium metabolism protein YedF
MTILDMTGKPCPIPVIEAKKALRSARPGDAVAILVDNDIARQNLQKMAEGLGHGFTFAVLDGGAIRAEIGVSEAARPVASEEGGLVVAVGRGFMGRGDDELGAALMKSFLYSLTELETPPEHLLFFNGGVRLTTSGSTALDDLAALTAKGAAVHSCGACLNYYGLTDQLRVGSVTNMYAIVSAMSQAKRLINL